MEDLHPSPLIKIRDLAWISKFRCPSQLHLQIFLTTHLQAVVVVVAVMVTIKEETMMLKEGYRWRRQSMLGFRAPDIQKYSSPPPSWCVHFQIAWFPMLHVVREQLTTTCYRIHSYKPSSIYTTIHCASYIRTGYGHFHRLNALKYINLIVSDTVRYKDYLLCKVSTLWYLVRQLHLPIVQECFHPSSRTRYHPSELFIFPRFAKDK